MAQMTMIQAITNAMATELKNDENVLVLGEDIGVNGGVFRATEGLQEEFGVDRVFDTPLAESGLVSLGLGLTLEDYRPVIEIQFCGFLFEAMDRVAGHIARHGVRSGASKQTPLVIRAPFGGGVNTPELHADSLEGLMAQTPALRVVIPSNPIDAK